MQLSRTFTVNIGKKLTHFGFDAYGDFRDWQNSEEGCTIFHSTEAKILILKTEVFKDRYNWGFNWQKTRMYPGLGAVSFRSSASLPDFFILFLQALKNHPVFFFSLCLALPYLLLGILFPQILTDGFSSSLFLFLPNRYTLIFQFSVWHW